MEAIAASSIQTSLTNGSAVTTTANAASAMNCEACSLQSDSFFNVSLSSTTINCHALLRLEVGAINAAFINVTTCSCVSSSSVNFRMLRRAFINSLKLSIYVYRLEMNTLLLSYAKIQDYFFKFAAMPLKLTTYYQGNQIPKLPGTNTFHSTELFHIYEATPGYTPLLIVASENGVPVAKLLAAIRKSVRLFPPSIIKRCEVYGTGEYFDETINKEAVFSDMLQRLTDEALRDAFLIEFRNLENSLFGYKVFRNNQYFAINWLRVRNSLHNVEQAEVRFSPSRIRQIKKGLKNGAKVKEAHTPEEIHAFAKMLHHNYSAKIRRHFPSMDFFQQLEKQMTLSRQSRIFIVTYKEKIIGGSACIYSDDNAYLWFSGGMRKTYALQYPGILAVWQALHDAKERGYRHLEFMDVGLPFRRHGYREFVLRFGGKQISTRRWFRFRWEWLNRVLIKIYE